MDDNQIVKTFTSGILGADEKKHDELKLELAKFLYHRDKRFVMPKTFLSGKYFKRKQVASYDVVNFFLGLAKFLAKHRDLRRDFSIFYAPLSRSKSIDFNLYRKDFDVGVFPIINVEGAVLVVVHNDSNCRDNRIIIFSSTKRRKLIRKICYEVKEIEKFDNNKKKVKLNVIIPRKAAIGKKHDHGMALIYFMEQFVTADLNWLKLSDAEVEDMDMPGLDRVASGQYQKAINAEVVETWKIKNLHEDDNQVADVNFNEDVMDEPEEFDYFEEDEEVFPATAEDVVDKDEEINTSEDVDVTI